MLFLLIMTYATVFTAELVGDKLLYSIGVLSTRYRTLPMLCGVGLAFMGKMTAAVLLGGFVAHLPPRLVAVVSAATFFTMAFALFFKAPDAGALEHRQTWRWSHAAMVSFAVVFFSEWGDPGQITAAALAARYQAPFVVWLGATLAMITKATLAMAVGDRLRKHAPENILRYCGVCLLFSLGIVSLLGFTT